MLLRKNKMMSLYSSNNKYYLFDGLSLTVYELSDSEYKLLKFSNNTFDEKKYLKTDELQNLKKNNILVPEEYEEFNINQKYRNAVKNKLILKNGRFSYIRISLTENCNLRCKYCFVNDIFSEKSNMSEETFLNLIDYCIKENSNKDLYVHYFGGEPLLKFDFIKKGHDKLNQAYKNKLITGFKEEIVTNGTLIDEECAKYLTDMKIDVVFSIDGWKEIHDAYRIYPDGSGSFDDMMKGIENIRKKSKDNIINVIMTPSDNCVLNQFTEIIQYIINEICPTSITINAPQPYEDGWHLDGKLFAEAIIKTWDMCKKNSINYVTPANSYIYAIKNKIPQVSSCMSSNDNGWGIYVGSDGAISPCVVERIKDKIGFEIFNDNMHSIRNDWHFSEEYIHCKNCKYLNVCSGICSVEKILLKGKKNYEKCKFTDRIIKWIITGD